MGETVSVVYQAIGVVKSPFAEPLPPEIMRAAQSWLVLDDRFAPALAALTVGQHLLVVYHLHRADAWRDTYLSELFTRRIACRPNPIGVTLVRIVALAGATITVVGLDALDGSPILDIKPYKPIYDAPPVHPAERAP